MEAETSPDHDLEPPKRPRISRIEAVVNEGGGGVGAGAAAELHAIIESFGIALRLASVGPREIEKAVRGAVASAPDLVVTLAGDGTARLAAELCGADGPMLAPLPGGTMNLLPHALYATSDWRAALKGALSAGVMRGVPGGVVGKRPFYVAAILGAPALWAPAREAVRHKKLRLALQRARHALARAFTGKLHFQLDGAPAAKAEALALLSPLISDVCVDEFALEAIVLNPRHAADVLRLGGRALIGGWRNDPAVSAQFCRHGHAFARRSIPCILDGEMQYVGLDVAIDFRPNAFRALAPAPTSVNRHDKAQTAET
jgi:diacylglycerol kinase family enzyme